MPPFLSTSIHVCLIFMYNEQLQAMKQFKLKPLLKGIQKKEECLFFITCRILGLQPLIPLLQFVNRLGVEICSVDRTRKLGYVNLNWPRCSAQVTESLALTDGSCCQKQNTLYFTLCKNL